MIKKIGIFFCTILIFSQIIFSSESLRISQIDTSSLLLDQNVRAYVSVTNEKGKAIKYLSKWMFNVSESADGKRFQKVKIVDFLTNANHESGINFLLLIDNSGSMYYDMNGKKTKNKSKMRITSAKNAVKRFLNSVKNPKDKVGLASYNAYYKSYTEPTSEKDKIYGHLEKIERPVKDEGWTEIYSSLYLAIDDFRRTKGRKAIIILSDGENMPYAKYAGRPHRMFGEKIFSYKEPIEGCTKEGISVFAINFGRQGEKKDKNLKKITLKTGGAVFNAYNKDELSGIYLKIMRQILSEYLITYRASMVPADKKHVKVTFKNKNKPKSVTRVYFSSMIFGLPLDGFYPFLLLALLLACILLLILSLIKFEKTKAGPSLELLDASTGTVVNKSLDITESKTVIGGSKNADMTILDSPSVQEEHATIVFDDNRDAYTIVSKEEITVNNNQVKTKVLESGDVINVGGTTIVFDEGAMKKPKK